MQIKNGNKINVIHLEQQRKQNISLGKSATLKYTHINLS